MPSQNNWSQVDAFLQPRQGFLHYNDNDANQLKFYVCTFTTNFTPSLLPSIFTLQCIRMFLNVHYIYYCSCIPPFSHLYDDCGALNAFNMLNIYGFYRYELRQYIKIAFKWGQFRRYNNNVFFECAIKKRTFHFCLNICCQLMNS